MSERVAARERIMGLDVGTHRIGVAVSDELQIIASPEATLHISQKTNDPAIVITEIFALVQQYAIWRIVVGLPRNMKGERGVQARWTEEFVTQLRTALEPLHVSIAFVDEQLTTAQAARTFQKPRSQTRGAWSAREESGQQESRSRTHSMRPPHEGRTSLDARAAALILQGYLDRRRNRTNRAMSNEQ